MKRILFYLSESIFFAALPIFGILSGGGFYLLKVGSTPTGWEWSIAPAIALAVFIAVVGAICGYGAISATTYSPWIRGYLGFVWIAQVGTNCLIIPVYFSASRISAQDDTAVSFQAAVDNLLTAGPSGWVEWGASLAMTLTGELGLCGLLLIMAAMSQEKAEKERKDEMRSMGENRVLILDAIRNSAYGMLTQKEIVTLTDLSYNVVNRDVRALVDEGILESDGAARNAKFSLVEED